MAGPLQNTLSVWHAIFLREMLQRLFGNRMNWAWLILEPAAHIVLFVTLWTAIRQRQMGGMDMASWLAVGMLAFFTFRRTGLMTLYSINCNKAFFAFRQVRPFDVAFIRACVEGYIMLFLSFFILGGAAFLGKDVFPHDVLLILAGFLGLWLFALGFGMVNSVVLRLIPETKQLLNFTMLPLYFISGVIIPPASIPLAYREYLAYNPLVHGIESIRMGFFPLYSTIPLNLGYLYLWALCSIVLGLVLYRIYEARLVAL